METLEQEEEEQQSPTRLTEKMTNMLPKPLNIQNPQHNQVPNETAISLPEDIISDILSRLPVKTLLQLRPLSKPFLSLISTPSFSRLQFSHATINHRTALLLSAYDVSTRTRYLLSATNNGGPLTIIATPHARTITNREATELEHVHGLVLCSSGNGFFEHNFAYVINPTTRNVFKLDGPASVKIRYGVDHVCYFFGYDESRGEHKVLSIRMLDVSSMNPFDPKRIEIVIFSMLSLRWRSINIDDAGLDLDAIKDWNIGTKHSVCVNSVIHVILQSQRVILAFDLGTEKFSIMKFPVDAVRAATSYFRKGLNTIISDQPYLMKMNGCLGLMCHNPAVGVNEMDIWILKDYENRVWVRETVGFLKSWFVLDGPVPLNPSLRKDHVVMKSGSSMRMINVHMYDVESRSVESVDFALDHRFLGKVRFDHVRRYTESILSLPRN